MDHVQEVLDEWCGASGAKFNTEKTKIIPIGTREYRARMIETRKVNQEERAPLDAKIKIMKDKEVIQLLGAWIGNDTEVETPWEPVVNRIHKMLVRYRKFHPTMTERKMIIQMVVGGYMQFLMQAQGMPTKIEDAITKMTQNFIWEENKSLRVTLDVLQYPCEEGGLNLLDIKARNEAIEIMWLKEYLNLSLMRPTWAKIADISIDTVAPQTSIGPARMNTFLQSWKPATRGGRARSLNHDITKMLKVAKTHKVSFKAIQLSKELKGKMLAWYQIGVENRPMNSKTVRCLINKHNA